MGLKIKFDFFTIFGVVFLAWGFFDLLLKIVKYGFKEYDFMWFCSIILFGLGFGLLLKNPVLMNWFLSIALVVQPIWVLDYLWVVFFGYPLNNNAYYIFQPTHAPIEFFNSLRHLLMLPFGFYGWYLLKEKGKNAWILVAASIIFVMVFSLLFTNPINNINCVFEPCTKMLDFGLPQNIYFIIFLLVIIVSSVVVSFVLNSIIDFLNKSKWAKKNKKQISWFVFIIFALTLLLVILMIIKGTLVYYKIPKLGCGPLTECVDCKVDLYCKYTTKIGPEFFLFYVVSNKNDKPYLCDLYLIEEKGKESSSRLIKEKVHVLPKYKKEFKSKIHYPSEDTRLTLNPLCEEAQSK